MILNGVKTVLLFGNTSQDVLEGQVKVHVVIFDPTISHSGKTVNASHS